MKNVSERINNSLLGGFDEIEKFTDPRNEIRQFINDNYKIRGELRIIKEPNKDGKYVVDGCGVIRVIYLNIRALTNNLFEWGKIYGNFECDHCKNLTSLEGAPKYVGGGFYCNNCESLASLKGAPKEVGGAFNCSQCGSLKTLEGCPEEVGGSFSCFDCKSLKTLEGVPKKIHEKILMYYSDNIWF